MKDTVTGSMFSDWPEFAEIGIEGLERRFLDAVQERQGPGWEVIHREVEPASTVTLNGVECEVVGPDILRVHMTATRISA
jgi:hypothetical protein